MTKKPTPSKKYYTKFAEQLEKNIILQIKKDIKK